MTTQLDGAVMPISPADAFALWMDHFELSETDAAHITGLPVNTITRLRRGSQPVTDEIATALADATKVPASRWRALQRHHAVWAHGVDCALAALRSPCHPATRTQESTMDQPRANAPEIPLYGTAATIRKLAGQWTDRLSLTGGTLGIATVLAQIAEFMREDGITYLSAADLDALSEAMHPAATEPTTPGS